MTDEQKVYIMLEMLLVVIWVAYRVGLHASRDEANKFDFSEAFLGEDGKTSMFKISYFVAIVLSSWTLVALVVTFNLTEWFYMAYVGSFVLGAVGGKFAGRDQK